MRTRDLQGKLSQANYLLRKHEDGADYYEKLTREQVEQINRMAKNYGYIIGSMKDLILQKMKPSFLSRFTWTRSAKRVLAEVNGLYPYRSEP